MIEDIFAVDYGALEQQRIVQGIVRACVPPRYRYLTVEMLKTPQRVPGVEDAIVAAVQKYLAERRWESGRGLYLWGPAGCGKTYAVSALACSLVRARVFAMYFDWSELLEMVSARHHLGQDQEEIEDAKHAHVLILDDLGLEVTTERFRAYQHNMLFSLVNSRYNRNAPIVYTSNWPLARLVERVEVAGEQGNPLLRITRRIAQECDVVPPELEGASRAG